MMLETAAFQRFVGRSTLFIGLAALAAGCASSGSQSTGASGSSSGQSSSTTSASGSGGGDVTAALDEAYVVGPTPARALGYRISWNADPGGGEAKSIALQGDSIFFVDSRNNLVRVLRESGNRVWSQPVGGSIDRVLGIVRATRGELDIVMALTEGDLHVFETGNGVQIDRQRLNQRVAATAPVKYGDMIIYGSLNGQVVWHHYNLNSFVRGSTLLGAISAPLILSGNVLVAVTDQGEVGALEAGGRGLVWRQTTRDPIVAAPAISGEAVYIAGRDQFIRCFDVRTGAEYWKHLHSEPLEESPVVIGDHVYVQTGDLGLCCYEALPYEDLDGNLKWSTHEAPGTVIGRRGPNLITWDDSARVVALIAEQSGELVDSVPVPSARTLLLDRFDNGDLYAIGDDGRMTRLVPQR